MGAVTSVKVTIDGVQVHSQGGAWTTVSSEARTFDLLQLKMKAVAELLAQADIQAGSYNQKELNVSKVVVVDNKGEHEAKLPSNKLQFKGDLEVKAEGTATANFDFLADQSLHLTGEGRYVMSPVIHVETRSNATAQVQANNEVKIEGGTLTLDTLVGMDLEGNIDVGLRITPDAVLTIESTGKVIQTKGQVLAVGTIKSVDSANGMVTITTKGGTELVLQVASNSSIKARGSSVTLANLAASVGSEVITRFNAETKTIAEASADADIKTKAEIGANLDLHGTIKAVDAAKGTMTIVTDNGADVVVKIAPDTTITVDGVGGVLSTVTGVTGLGLSVGSRIDGQYDTSTGTVGQLKSESTVKATGTIKAVDVLSGTITITNQTGTDLALKVESKTRLLGNGSMVTLASLKTLVGSEATVAYSQQSKVIGEMNVRGQAETTTRVIGTLKAISPAEGTVTIATATSGDVVLKVAADSKVLVGGTVSTLANLAASIGSQVTIEYNVQTKVATSVAAQAQASATASVSGTLKAVDVLGGTITITGQTGIDVKLKVTSSTKVQVAGSAASIATLATKAGSGVTAQYDVQTMTATSVMTG